MRMFYSRLVTGGVLGVPLRDGARGRGAGVGGRATQKNVMLPVAFEHSYFMSGASESPGRSVCDSI